MVNTPGLACILTPQRWGTTAPPGVPVIADNGCYGKGFPGEAVWLDWLADLEPGPVLFAVAPDVVGDAAATLARSAPWLGVIRQLGLPAAFVAQDGLEHHAIPWADFDALFIGGSTAWKLGAHAQRIAAAAKARGHWLHMGRVNSERRLRYARHIGCDSVDGTYLAFGPDVNLPRLLAWLRALDQPDLFGWEAWSMT
jgi:hypothetical protein